MHQPKSLVLVLALIGCSSAESAGPGAGGASGSSGNPEWLGYGHDFENTRANTVETKISVATAPSLVEKWRAQDLIGVTSTPVVRDGIVYYGSWDGAAIAVDAVTGTQLWKTQLIGPGAPNHISHTPYVTEDTIYIGGLGGVLWALDRATGSKVWPEGIVSNPDGSPMLWSSP